jgi:hypothetical protein
MASDSGRYSCIAKNQNGEDETECKVVVAGTFPMNHGYPS